MFTSAYCNKHLNASEITLKNVVGEIKEMFDVGSVADFKDELSDVMYFTYCFIESKTGINLPMYGADSTIRKISKRLDMWDKIFNEMELKFDKKYLVNGSNYKRQDKLVAAIKLAIEDQA